MATPNNSRREHPSTYFVQDRSNIDELNRLRVQDQMFNDGMGGVLSEQPDASVFKRVLDVGCGSGSWVFETAQTYPHMSVFGIDISGRMMTYAREQAQEQGLTDRVEFRVMDALRMLEYPTNYFDLTNMRLGSSFLRKWDWPGIIEELQRVTKPGGIIRITEAEVLHTSTSPAVVEFCTMMLCTFFRAGHLFEESSTGLTDQIVPMLTQYGVKDVQSKLYPIVYRAGTPAGEAYYQDIMHGMKTIRPFIQKWGCLAENFNDVYQRAEQEMKQSDFHSTWTLLTAWGKAP